MSATKHTPGPWEWVVAEWAGVAPGLTPDWDRNLPAGVKAIIVKQMRAALTAAAPHLRAKWRVEALEIVKESES